MGEEYFLRPGAGIVHDSVPEQEYEETIDPDAIVVSPGPGTPEEAGISMDLFADRTHLVLSCPTTADIRTVVRE